MKTSYTPASVDEYINTFPKDTQSILLKIRTIIQRGAPEAVENISYGMPAYKTNGKPLVYFACFKNHIGFYALPSGHSKFSAELSAFKQGKGSVQFPLNQSIPFELIAEIVAYRVQENKNNTLN